MISFQNFSLQIYSQRSFLTFQAPFIVGMCIGVVFLFSLNASAEKELNQLNNVQKLGDFGTMSPENNFLDKNLFQKGEYFFNRGKNIEAKKQFQKYFYEESNKNNIDQTIFRLAQIEFRERYYATSLRYFKYLLDYFPESPWITKGLFISGICHFELDQLGEAQKVFENQLKTNPDPYYRWKSLYYLGLIDEKNLDYFRVINKLREVYENIDDSETRAETVRITKRVINEKLSLEELVQLVEHFKDGFPVDLLLWKLISEYLLGRDIERYRATLEKLIRLFPQSPDRERVEKLYSYSKDWFSEDLKLGAILPLTGPRALTGQQVLQGIQLAFNQMRHLMNIPVKLEVRDSGASGSVWNISQELATNPNVLSIIGPILSKQVKEISSLSKEYHIPFLTPTASNPGLPDLSPFIFRNALTREVQARYLAQYAVNDLNLKRFVILYPDESFGEELYRIFAEEVRGFGGEVVSRISYDREQTDFKTQILDIGGISDNDLKKITIRKLRQGQEGEDRNFEGKVPFSKPVIDKGLWNEETVEGLKVSLELSYDAIFIPGFYDKVALIVPQLIFYNLDKLTLLGTNGWHHPDLINIAGRFLNNRGIFVDGFFKGSRDNSVKNFVREFKSTFGEEPSIFSAQAYDSARILLELIQDGAQKRDQLQARLFMVKNYAGVSGRTTFLPSGESDKKLFALKIHRNKFVQIN